MREAVPTSALYVRIPLTLRARLDAELHRQKSGDDGPRRWSLDMKTLVTELLSGALPPVAEVKPKKKK